MLKPYLRLWLIIFIACYSLPVAAQQSGLISGDFAGLRFPQAIEKIESATSYYFYYDPAGLDSFIVNSNANNISLNAWLKAVFYNTSYHFSIDSLNRVYITQRIPIITRLPEHFFERNRIPADTSFTHIVLLNNTGKKEDTVAANENKIYQIGAKGNGSPNGKATLAGYVRDTKTGEAIVGAVVSADSSGPEIITDGFGYYSITLPKGSHVLNITSLGMKDTRRQIVLNNDGKLNIELQNHVATLKEVIVLSEKRSNVKGLQMGLERLSINTIRHVPVAFGEADVLKVVLTLPGVTTAGEASTGFNVRGGATDQNLILFGDATIYNPSHLFGFFSSFNPDVVKGVELYKSTIPEKYGGRLSSVLDVTTRDGNSKKLAGDIGIGPLTSKITIEGPIKKDKTTFILSGRLTYSDWLLHAVKNKDYNNSQASFSDYNALLTHTINSKNTIYLTGYLSYDKFKLNSDTLYKYGNKNANIKWKHIFNNKMYDVVTAGYDHYEYGVSASRNPVNAYQLNFNINQAHFKADFNYSPNNKNKIDFGFNSIYYLLHPGSITPNDDKSLVKPDALQKEQALESALYVGLALRLKETTRAIRCSENESQGLRIA